MKDVYSKRVPKDCFLVEEVVRSLSLKQIVETALFLVHRTFFFVSSALFSRVAIRLF